MAEKTFRVLLVDDSLGDVELTKLALRKGKFLCDVEVAENGRDGMRLLDGHHLAGRPLPDLVLLDINMPLMNGHEMLQAMKAAPHLAGIPVVMLTTSDVERDVVASYGMGANGYIAKPVEFGDLIKSIQAVEEYWFAVVRRPAGAFGE